MATRPRRAGFLRGLTLTGATLLGPTAAAEPPKILPASAMPPTAPAAEAASADAGKRAVAYIYNGVPITREDLGDFLIARGGMDKIDLLVNRRVIEVEAARRGITVTGLEVEAGLNDDLTGLTMRREQFVQTVLPRYNKSMYEWEQDVIRPRLLLGKMVGDRARPTDDELKRAFESRFGEKREALVVVWPKGNPKIQELSAEVKAAARANPEEFKKLAANQPNDLAKTGGRITPIGRNIDGESPGVEAALFGLKEGEVSPWVEDDAAKTSTCILCLKIIPPDPAVTPDKVRATVEKEVRDKKLNAEIPKLFAEIKQAANPALTVHVPPRPPADPNVPAPARVPHPDPKVLAVVYGTIPITRDDLGDFIIARGGYEKLDLLVNRRIIEAEAAKKGVGVTPAEIDAALDDDVKAMGVLKDDFVKVVLPKYGKSLGEWTEDVIKPRLVLTKMCRDRVTVTPDDLQKLYENRYGEKRQAKIILWAKDEFRLAQKQWNEVRKGDAEFDSVARGQRDPNLAAAAGMVAPIGRHTDAENPLIEQAVFTLKVGEVSQLFETSAGIVCVKNVGVVPAVAGVTPESVRAALEKDVFERKLAKEIPAYFAGLRQAANPNLLLKGPPTARENADGVKGIIRQIGNQTPAAAAAPTPPKK